ncbi:MAG: hypothetical protein M3Q03_03820 [Chloroflexota bacterium]|nr:hypothetical protein [Chloroflexota bacterium]
MSLHAILANISTPTTALPDHAPSRGPPRREAEPGRCPHRTLLARAGVDATNLDDLMCYARERGWVWRLGGGRTHPRC